MPTEAASRPLMVEGTLSLELDGVPGTLTAHGEHVLLRFESLGEIRRVRRCLQGLPAADSGLTVGLASLRRRSDIELRIASGNACVATLRPDASRFRIHAGGLLRAVVGSIGRKDRGR